MHDDPPSLPPPAASEGEEVRGAAWLRAGERLALRLDAAVLRLVPAEQNPLAETGALANLMLLVAIATGILLLVWYSSDLHAAYGSVRAMDAAPYTSGLVRSLHRYSSDATMLLIVLHAARLFLARRFAGARWLAWVTGVALLGLVWLVGWLGYWIVWDERGHLVALGTARVLDALPIFTDPLARSLLSDARVSPFLFFVMFFLHMLVPLAIGLALWLHLSRIARPRWIPSRPLALFALLGLLVLSVAHPATAAGAAHMGRVPRTVAVDGWYLAPIWLSERLSGPVLLGLGLGATLALLGLPWALRRAAVPIAAVEPANCNACRACYEDCPYDAISLVARGDPTSRFAEVAKVDASRCTACGVCAGSCDSLGVGVPWLLPTETRDWVQGLLDDARFRSAPTPSLIFACQGSAGARLATDPQTGTAPELPGHRVAQVPCIGWVNPTTVQRALRDGVPHVLLVGCGEGSCTQREGATWTEARMAGLRKPPLREKYRAEGRVTVARLFPHERAELLAAARAGVAAQVPAAARRRPLPAWVGGAALCAVLMGAVGLGSEVTFHSPRGPEPELVVSFKHPGELREAAPRAADPRLLPHMRAPTAASRERLPVRLRVRIDGVEVLRRSYAPRGLWGDGNSIAIERLAVTPGEHGVQVELGDGADPEHYGHATERRITFEEGASRTLLFDRMEGFAWH